MTMSSLRGYLKPLRPYPLHPSIPFEEIAPDLGVTTETRLASLLGVIDINLLDLEPREMARFFVDGVQRSAIIQELRIVSPPVPLVASHIVVGAFERGSNGKIRPVIIREALLVLFPRIALMQALGSSLRSQLSSPPPLPVLDSRGDFYVKVCQSQLGRNVNMFFVDPSLTFEKSPRVSIRPSELAAIGKVRRIMLDRVTHVMRTLEVGIVSELRQKYPKDLVLLDGPLVRMMFLIYARLADTRLEYLVDLTDARKSYEFLSKVIGIVKEVRRVPQNGLKHAFNVTNVRQHIPIFRFTDPKIERDFRHLLSCFMWLRPELSKHMPLVGSVTGGLVRIDVPIPAVTDYDPAWIDSSFQVNINPGSSTYTRLEAILRGIIIDRLPLPPTSRVHRLLTELYPISEAERFLKSRLLTHEELRLII